MEDIMRTTGLQKSYKGTVAVNNVNIHIPKGAFMALWDQMGQAKVQS